MTWACGGRFGTGFHNSQLLRLSSAGMVLCRAAEHCPMWLLGITAMPCPCQLPHLQHCPQHFAPLRPYSLILHRESWCRGEPSVAVCPLLGWHGLGEGQSLCV